jgi:hypothetical protein
VQHQTAIALDDDQDNVPIVATAPQRVTHIQAPPAATVLRVTQIRKTLDRAVAREDCFELLKNLLHLFSLARFIDTKSDVLELGFHLAESSVDFLRDVALERHFDCLHVRLQRCDILHSRSIRRRTLAKLAHVWMVP